MFPRSGRTVKILILKASALGDVVQALPILRLIKQHLPASEIYWWIDESLGALVEDDPDLSGVLTFERRKWRTRANLVKIWQDVLWMRRQRFDWVIDLQGLLRTGVFAWLANGKFNVGMDEPREGARGFYEVIVRRPSFHTHAVDWYLEVLKVLHVPVNSTFEWLPPRQAAAKSIRSRWPVDHSKWILLQPGARWSNKRWPVDHFATLAQQLLGQFGDHSIVVSGSQADAPLGQAVAAVNPKRCLDLTGQLSLPEMIEWIRASSWVITNDTGPMHVAAALKRPVTALFGPTDPKRTGPYGQIEHALQMRLECVPCFKSYCAHTPKLECLQTLSPSKVFAAVCDRYVPSSPQ